MPNDRSYNPPDLSQKALDLEEFMRHARNQIGDRYKFGAEVEATGPDYWDPKAFDSSELVEWAAHQADVRGMPDGTWNQYRWLHDQGAAVSVEDALKTRGALVFGFSSDPRAPGSIPDRRYVAISVGDGKNVIDVSERAGEVREMPHGGFYKYGALIPDFHEMPAPAPTPGVLADRDGDGVPDDPLRIPGGVGPSRPSQPTPVIPDDPVDPSGPAKSYGPDGRIIHEQFPGDEQYPGGMPPQSGPVCTPDDPPPEERVCRPEEELPPEEPVCRPEDGGGPLSQADPIANPLVAGTPTYADASDFGAGRAGDAGAPTYSDPYADQSTDLSADV